MSLMVLSRRYSPTLILGAIFVLMLALAASIEITGNDIARRVLVILIPVGGVILGAVSAIERESKIELAAALILSISAGVATVLAIIGAGPFSNRIVNLAIIGSVAGLRFNQPLQTTIQGIQRFVN
jgi:hypothetical protein